MRKIAVVYHSDAGHTLQLAKAFCQGAKQEGSQNAVLYAVEEIDKYWDELDDADAIIFGSPTYMGTVSGQFKIFMDKTSTRWFERSWQDKLAGGFTNSGSLSGDKLGTLSALSVFAAQHGMIWIGPAEICTSFDPKPTDINRLGSQLGVMSQCDPYAPVEESPPDGDKETSRLFGVRIAKMVKIWSTSEFNSYE